MSKLSSLLGVARSLLMYYAVPGRAGAWRGFYRGFVKPGGLAFDVGAHVGNRTGALLAIGTRVVAVEPQPAFAGLLRRLYGRNHNFTLWQCALGAAPGRAQLMVSSRTPTVSTLSPDWAAQVGATASFSSVRWDQQVDVEVRTLDALIAEYGLPDFCKLDIEGNELEVLRGLSVAIPAISFEFLIPTLTSAFQCLDRLVELGDYEVNFIKGEYPRFASAVWMDAKALRHQLSALPDDGRAGEVYARLAG
jgi:FkbM family methyltransferase